MQGECAKTGVAQKVHIIHCPPLFCTMIKSLMLPLFFLLKTNDYNIAERIAAASGRQRWGKQQRQRWQLQAERQWDQPQVALRASYSQRRPLNTRQNDCNRYAKTKQEKTTRAGAEVATLPTIIPSVEDSTPSCSRYLPFYPTAEPTKIHHLYLPTYLLLQSHLHRDIMAILPLGRNLLL